MNIFKRVHLIENPYAYSVGDKVRVFPSGLIGIVTERKVMIDFPYFRLKKYYTVVNKVGKRLELESDIVSVFENVLETKEKPTLFKNNKAYIDSIKKACVSIDDLKKSFSNKSIVNCACFTNKQLEIISKELNIKPKK